MNIQKCASHNLSFYGLWELNQGKTRNEYPDVLFLFTIVVKALSSLLRKVKDCGLMDRFNVGQDGMAITNLQFAVDTIIFSSSKWEEVAVLKRILRCFELSRGLKINLAKSMLVGVGCSEEVVQPLVRNLACNVGKLPCIYLGLPLGGNSRSKSFWDPVVEKFERRLSSWKRNYLSIGGRITLIKAMFDYRVTSFFFGLGRGGSFSCLVFWGVGVF